MNLGDKLKAANEVRASENSKAEVAKRESDRMQYDADRRIILAFLERAKEEIVIAIENGVTVKPLKIPTDPPFNTYRWRNKDIVGTFGKTDNLHFSAFESFFTWADENGLVGKFVFDHDGYGISSWFVVMVEPKK